MSQHEQILERMRHTNPVADLDVIHDSDLASLTSLLDQGRLAMTDLKQPVRRQTSDRDPGPRRWRRPAQAFAAALVLVLGTIGVVALLMPGESDDVGTTPVAPTAVPGPAATEAPPTEASLPPLGDLVNGTWQDRPVEFTPGDVEDTSFGLVAAAVGGVWISPDGAIWRRSLEESESYLDAVTEYHSVLYAFGSISTGVVSERNVWRSDDGSAWTRMLLGPPDMVSRGAIGGVVAAGDTLLHYLSVDDEGTVIFLSGNGEDWTAVESDEAGLASVELSNVIAIGDRFPAVGTDSSADTDLFMWGKRSLYTSDTGAVWEAVPGSEFQFDAFPDDAMVMVGDVLYVAGFVFDGDWTRPTVWQSQDLRTFEEFAIGLEPSVGFVRDLLPTTRGLVVVAWLDATEDDPGGIVLLASSGESTLALVADPDGLLAGTGDPSDGAQLGDQIMVFGHRLEGPYQSTQ